MNNRNKAWHRDAEITKRCINKKNLCVLWASVANLFLVTGLQSLQAEILLNYGQLTAELDGAVRGYYQSNAHPDQKDASTRLMASADYKMEWLNGDTLQVSPWIRFDSMDPGSNYFDLREFNWNRKTGDWDLHAGLGRVNWWATESQHLVDIINQVDLIEMPDGETKLGQPMLNANYQMAAGRLEMYVLPLFREREFANSSARLRFSLPIDDEHPLYEDSNDTDQHIDYATRYSFTHNTLDMGVSAFYGTSRDPSFEIGSTGLQPFYSIISQIGVDMTWVQNAWIWKFESISRNGQKNLLAVDENYIALITGFEYDVSSVFDNRDSSLLLEYMYDQRRENSLSGFDNDLFLGLRTELNSETASTLLLAMIQDLSQNSRILLLEAEHRLRPDMKLFIDAYVFGNIDVTDLLYDLRQDDFIQVRLAWYF